LDGRRPGTADYDFRSILQVLRELSYAHWCSVEVFDFTGGGEKIGLDSIRFLKAQLR
jgi:sugar phosphate isomerase/epimerase